MTLTYFSGIHVKYNLSLPVGSRVVSAAVRCAQCQVPAYSPIDPEASYSLVASSFLANGGDNYTMIAEHKTVLEQFGEFMPLEYLKDHFQLILPR